MIFESLCWWLVRGGLWATGNRSVTLIYVPAGNVLRLNAFDVPSSYAIRLLDSGQDDHIQDEGTEARNDRRRELPLRHRPL